MTREELEEALVQKAEVAFENTLDLNVDTQKLEAQLEELKSVRIQLLEKYGVPARRKAAPAGSLGPEEPGQTGQQRCMADTSISSITSWKSVLLEALTKRHGRGPAKSEIIFDTFEDSERRGFFSTVSSTNGWLSSSYSCQAPAPSKKAAETEAARIAFEAEFPEQVRVVSAHAPMRAGMTTIGQKRSHFEMISGQAGRVLADAPPLEECVATSGSGGKRKNREPEDVNVKGKLGHAVSLLLGRFVVKGDMDFDTVGGDGGGFVCTVRLPTYDPEQSWTGPICENKKVAENRASKVALLALEPVVIPLKKSHEEKKQRQAEEKRLMQAQKKGAANDEEAPII